MKSTEFANLTLQDALDLAIATEQEARQRYEQFVAQLGHRYKNDATDFFTHMAENETRHETTLRERRRQLFGDTPVNLTPAMASQAAEIEAPDTGEIRSFMSTTRALQVALAAEERARDFYAKVLPVVKNEAVRRLFAELHAEEIEHVEMVRKIIAKTVQDGASDIPDEEVDTPEL